MEAHVTRRKQAKLREFPRAPFPASVRPMLATLTDAPFSDPDWIYEIKWDGYRMIAGIRNREATLTSRNLISYTRKFPAIARTLGRIRADAVIDGEVVAVDRNGISHFQLLQNFQQTGEGSIRFFAFDILWLEGHDLRNVPLLRRKELLAGIVPGHLDNVGLSEHVAGEGKKLFAAAKRRRLEGVIAKRSDSPYREGKRTRDWLKIKTGLRQEAVICGFTEPRGTRRFFGSLILGLRENGGWRYIGHTGTGFSEASLRQLRELLLPYEQSACPFAIPPKTNEKPTWVKPKFVCEVSFTEWTGDGYMRHPVFEGLREDKPAREAVREKGVRR